MRKLIYLMLLTLTACDVAVTEEAEAIPLARVGETYLYNVDIVGTVPDGLSGKDSIQFVRRVVDTWVEETLLVQKAEDNLDEEQKNVEKQLTDYRNSLITYIYQKGLIEQYLDTLVTHEEIEKYYEANKSDFQLKDNIIRVVYIKLNRETPKFAEIRYLYKSNRIKDRAKLAEYCHQFAENYYLNDESWLLFDDLLKEIPIKTYDKEAYLKNHRYIEVSDSTSVYLLNIKGFKIRESESPLNFELDNIKNIILNKRKLALINKMKNEITQEALNKNKVEIYIDDKQE